MPWFDIIWNDEIIAHLAEHGIGVEEAECVLMNPFEPPQRSRSNPLRWVAFGETNAGRRLIVIYEQLDETTILPVTAYENED